MPPLKRIVVSATALLLAVLLPAAPALAAVTPWQLVDVRLIDSQGTPYVLVGGQLAQNAKLPADVLLSAPTGTKIDWSGEVIGVDPSKDPSRPYKSVAKSGYDEISMTLSQARYGQIEFASPSSVQTSGEKKTATLTWIAPAAVSAVTLNVETPQGAKIADNGGGQQQASGNSTFYTKQFTNVKAGQKVTLKVVYSGGTFARTPTGGTGTGGTGTSNPQSSNANVVPFLLLIGLALGGVMYFAIKRQGGLRHEYDDEYDDDEYYDDEYFEDEEEEVKPKSRRGKRAVEHEEESDGEDDFSAFDDEEEFSAFDDDDDDSGAFEEEEEVKPKSRRGKREVEYEEEPDGDDDFSAFDDDDDDFSAFDDDDDEPVKAPAKKASAKSGSGKKATSASGKSSGTSGSKKSSASGGKKGSGSSTKKSSGGSSNNRVAK